MAIESQPSMEPKPKALIVGAGIAGLSAAWWLDKAGWSSVLIDKSPTIRDGGYVISLSGLGYQTVQQMNLENLEAITYKFRENAMHDYKGNELLRLRYEDFHGVESMALCRGDLARALAEALPESATIRLGETLTEVADDGEKIRATLKGGDRIEADLLIGADGIRSTVRGRFWQGADCLDQLGYSYAVYDVDDEKDLKSSCVSFSSPGRIDNFYCLRQRRVAALHIWRDEETRQQDRQLPFKILRDVTAGSPQLISDIMNRAESAGSKPIIDSLTMVTLPQWSKGRVVLLGDSAHCLSLISGQGACMALASAEILGDELKRTRDVSQALLNHERRLRPVIEKLQQRTRKLASMYLPRSVFKYHLRNLFLRLMPYSWIVSWHVKNLRAETDLTTQA